MGEVPDIEVIPVLKLIVPPLESVILTMLSVLETFNRSSESLKSLKKLPCVQKYPSSSMAIDLSIAASLAAVSKAILNPALDFAYINLLIV